MVRWRLDSDKRQVTSDKLLLDSGKLTGTVGNKEIIYSNPKRNPSPVVNFTLILSMVKIG